MAYNYISLKALTDKLLRHPMMNGISFEAIVDYAVDFMRIVQCGGFFEEKCVTIPIYQYKGALPEDFYEINQLRLINNTIKVPKYIQDNYRDENNNEVPLSTYTQIGYEDLEYTNNATFRHATDTFHLSDTKSKVGLTYKIQGGFIFTSIKEGEVELSYKAIIIDDEGFPMIPDNSKFTRALESYIKKQWFTILFDMGKIQNAVLQNTQQEYAWAVGACESEFQKMTLDKAESFYNSWRTLIPREYQHSRNFAYNGNKQHLKNS